MELTVIIADCRVICQRAFKSLDNCSFNASVMSDIFFIPSLCAFIALLLPLGDNANIYKNLFARGSIYFTFAWWHWGLTYVDCKMWPHNVIVASLHHRTDLYWTGITVMPLEE